MRNYLTIDVEDYFHVSAFEHVVRQADWDKFESRVVNNCRRILTLLDAHGVKATFFVLGWVAEHYPDLVREIEQGGHEIACHSFYHRLVYDLTPDEFREDTLRAKNILEQITGKPVFGYRAPSYSITGKSLWAFDILEELGFTYDSSVFPIYHDRYGIPDAPRFPYMVPGHNLKEYPISTSMAYGLKVPVSGGGYFRLFPYNFIRWALRKVNREENQPFIFYLHPWEIDPEQPRVKTGSLVSKFRHYVNLSKTQKRFHNLLTDFSFCPIEAPRGKPQGISVRKENYGSDSLANPAADMPRLRVAENVLADRVQ